MNKIITFRTNFIRMALLGALLVFVLLVAGPDAASAQTNTLQLRVVSARTEPDAPGGPVVKGDAIPEYKYLINVDDTGDPTQVREAGCTADDPGYPDSCDWPSIRAIAGAAPIYTQGNQDDFSGGGIPIPDGKYLISVLAGDYKVGGIHFEVPLPGPDAGGDNLVVELQPNPLPPATMRIRVFEDITPVNGQFDPGEQSLVGFKAVINDTVGEISTDVFGNPLCTEYDANGDPIGVPVWDDPATPAVEEYTCLFSGNPAVENGDIVIPNLGPLRYDVLVNPPEGEFWLETTTLEGSPSWDTWLAEGGTGLDNEFVVAGEPFPWTVFGFVQPCTLGDTSDRCPANDGFGGPHPATGGISGSLIEASIYLPQQGGLPYVGDIWTGFNGTKVTGPISDGWVAISDLQQGDTVIYVGPANADGTFAISGLPDGDYLVTWWDYNLNHILDWLQVTVSGGQMTNMGTPMLTGWFTKVEGYVFIDSNKNGIKDPGEEGLANYVVVLRDRDNSEIDRMSISATTEPDGYYVFEKAYPMGSWMVLEAYNDRYYTTGITYQVDNQTELTTVLGNGVDVGILPILGQPARLDWGIYPYEAGTNGGIVGSVFYDTTRNELDPRYQAVEPWAAGIPGRTMNLYAPVPCTDPSTQSCDARGDYQLAADGSYMKGTLLNTTTTETWEQPSGCTARDANGDPLPWGIPNQQVLPTGDHATQDTSKRCLEAPLMGTQIQSGFATLDGNWGFAEGCMVSGAAAEGECNDPLESPLPLQAGDYLVEVDPGTDALGHDMYQVVREEDINIFGGDQYVPAVPPAACAGALHTVDVAGIGDDGPAAVDNPTFADGGGSPFEGQEKPLCDVKLVNLANGKSVAPVFTYFTDVPIPGRWKGYIISDLAIASNPTSLNFGEKDGLANAPIGIYDPFSRLVTTIQSDPNGVFEVLLPSTHTMNCPTPSGVCANIYYMLGNDPGQPGALNSNYNPQFRTIGASFEIYPGLWLPSDLAPTQIVPGVLAAGTQYGTPPQCNLNDPANPTTPELFAVDHPYVPWGISDSRQITIYGQGFLGDGSMAPPGTAYLDGTALNVGGWTDTLISVDVPANAPVGPHQLMITTADGQSLVNGLTIHVFGVNPFDGTPVLDNFDRTGFGGDWTVDNIFSLDNNNVRVTGGNSGNNINNGTMRWSGTAGGGPVYGPNQGAFFTFVKVSPSATEQGLFLKVTGNGNNPNPTASQSAYVEVSYNATSNPTSVQVRTKANGTSSVVLQASFPATFAAGDELGTRVMADGTVFVYKNGSEIGSVNVTGTASPWPAGNVAAGGRLGIRFVGVDCNNANCTNGNDARFDDFGGGTVSAYEPAVYEVGPGKSYGVIQDAIDAELADPGDGLVVVYPGTGELWNPTGAYYENLIMTAPVKLQGVGPGGVYADNTAVLGSVVDGRGLLADTTYADEWRTKMLALTWSGNQAIYEGAVVTIVADDGEFGSRFKAAIDGFTITGGDQQGIAANLTPTTPETRAVAAIQGGGIFANGYARYLQITNNVVRSNGGAYAGAVRLGTPHLPADLNGVNYNDNQNDFVRIAHNRIVANGGTNLAGAIGLFSGSEGYQVAYNDICGNYSAEYGGGISHYGFSPNGQIHHNRVYFNRAYDEGGGIIIAGELPADPGILTPGAGPVDVYNNLIQANLGNDDGGGLRFLMAGDFPYNVYNNMVVNNVSTHEGGGISINDAPDVRVFNNTIMKNITTATAMTSNGQPAPAGLSTSRNSALLQSTLANNAPLFSEPLTFNNVFCDNRAGTFTGATVAGIGLMGDPGNVFHWDLGLQDQSLGQLMPTYSILQTTYGTIPGGEGNIIGCDPGTLVVTTYDTSVQVQPWRGNPRFVDTLMVTALADPNVLGDYHLASGASAIDVGAPSQGGINAPGVDFDDQIRPNNIVDMGADEWYATP